jgi:hypothetical protein
MIREYGKVVSGATGWGLQGMREHGGKTWEGVFWENLLEAYNIIWIAPSLECMKVSPWKPSLRKLYIPVIGISCLWKLFSS